MIAHDFRKNFDVVWKRSQIRILAKAPFGTTNLTTVFARTTNTVSGSIVEVDSTPYTNRRNVLLHRFLFIKTPGPILFTNRAEYVQAKRRVARVFGLSEGIELQHSKEHYTLQNKVTKLGERLNFDVLISSQTSFDAPPQEP